ncbi:MAG: hypothetical protein O2826_02620 [Chloroflexi bacterium]|nr:hypothetical protein [Chloroflexota bacterium]MDA1173393.1 hypothetical protein [Chloroflexota bacterium]
MHIKPTVAKRLVPVIVVGMVVYALIVGLRVSPGYVGNLVAFAAVMAIPLLAAVLLFRLARQLWTGGRQTPLDVAKERYARGEIDRVAFEEIKDTLDRP